VEQCYIKYPTFTFTFYNRDQCCDFFQAILDAFEHVLPQIAPCFNVDAWHRCFSKVTHMMAAKLP